MFSGIIIVAVNIKNGRPIEFEGSQFFLKTVYQRHNGLLTVTAVYHQATNPLYRYTNLL